MCKLFNLLLIIVVILMTSCEAESKVIVTDLKCEYRTNSLGIDNTEPRLSWIVVDALKTRGQKQTAYHILVASSLQNLAKNNKGFLRFL